MNPGRKYGWLTECEHLFPHLHLSACPGGINVTFVCTFYLPARSPPRAPGNMAPRALTRGPWPTAGRSRSACRRSLRSTNYAAPFCTPWGEHTTPVQADRRSGRPSRVSRLPSAALHRYEVEAVVQRAERLQAAGAAVAKAGGTAADAADAAAKEPWWKKQARKNKEVLAVVAAPAASPNDAKSDPEWKKHVIRQNSKSAER